MPDLPETDDTPLVRTDFSDEGAWRELLEAIRMPSDEGFLANLSVLDDPAFAGADMRVLCASEAAANHAILLLADAETMAGAERSLLCVDASDPDRTFRVVPAALWGVENNLSIANMDFDEFADHVDGDGVFRGF